MYIQRRSAAAAAAGPGRGVRARRARGAALTSVFAIVCGAVLARSPLVDLDTDVLRWAASARRPGVYEFLSVWVLLGQRAVCLGLAAAWLAVRALRSRDLRPLITLLMATLLLNASVGLVKAVIGRLGPTQLGAVAVHPGASTVFANGTIFPSGHAANAVVTWGLLAWLARRRRRSWGVAAGLLAASVGLSTLYLGTHWMSDVLAGWTAGGLILMAVPVLVPLADRLAQRAGAAVAWLWDGATPARPERMRA